MPELTDFDHEPLASPRPGFIGECAFAAVWKAAMTAPSAGRRWDGSDEHPIDAVLANFHLETTQRDVSILASMASWLGTNCGYSILHRAEHGLAGVGYERYLMAWAAENTRKRGINHFGRTIEAFAEKGGCMEFTVRDLEVCDSMMLWLPTSEGQAFLAAARAEYARQRDERDRNEARLWREHVAKATSAAAGASA